MRNSMAQAWRTKAGCAMLGAPCPLTGKHGAPPSKAPPSPPKAATMAQDHRGVSDPFVTRQGPREKTGRKPNPPGMGINGRRHAASVARAA
jgi:hypothetical protein